MPERAEKMIRTLSGLNSFLRQAEQDRLIAEYLKTHGEMGLERLDGEEAEYDRIRESLESLPFLANKKLVVLRAPGANKQFVENAQKLLKELPESTDVIIVEPKLDKRSSYYKFLQKQTDFTEFLEMDENSLVKWLINEAKRVNGNINQTDARYLVSRVGLNQQLLSNELKKLLDYDPEVTRESIELLTEPSPQSTIFELLDAAFGGKRTQVLKLYLEQRALKVEPSSIIALLAWQMHALAVIKTAGERSDSEIAAEAKLNPFVVRKTRGLAKNITYEKLKQSINELVELDLAMKTTSIDADDALQAYLLKLG